MLNKTSTTALLIVFMFIFQQPTFAHFINSELEEKIEIAKIETEKIKAIKEIENLGYVDFIKNESLYDIMDKAAKLNKPIFIDFYTDWCSPCRIMDQEVFSKPSVAKYMNTNYINFKVDASTRSGNNLAYRYNAKMLPTFVIINSKGDLISKKTGLMNSGEFISFARNANATIY